jgi:hypothetical protein
MARAAALGGGAYGNLIHIEASVAKPFGKQRVRPGRPHRKHAARPQGPVDRLQPVRIIERIIGFADQALRPVIDIEQDRIERARIRLNDIDNIGAPDAGPGIVKTVPEQLRRCGRLTFSILRQASVASASSDPLRRLFINSLAPSIMENSAPRRIRRSSTSAPGTPAVSICDQGIMRCF